MFDLETSFELWPESKSVVSVAVPCSKHLGTDEPVLWGSEGLSACVPQCCQSNCEHYAGCLVRLQKLLFVELVVLLTFLPTCCWIHWGLELQLSLCCSFPIVQVTSAVFWNICMLERNYILGCCIVLLCLGHSENCAKNYVSNLGNKFWYLFDHHPIHLWRGGSWH